MRLPVTVEDVFGTRYGWLGLSWLCCLSLTSVHFWLNSFRRYALRLLVDPAVGSAPLGRGGKSPGR